ncbi:MAG TPA: YiiX/YebB-like N1pC/P60 family cysteine hydrolase [Pseudomonadales bacterium]|nr:YiiX/YebB-like N1pC/P60 family cysteine hydrolase [Pseudomonadales bacterium]
MTATAAPNGADIEPADLIRVIEDDNAAYHALPRHGGDAWQVLDAKLRSIHRRQRRLDRLLAADGPAQDGPARDALVAALLALGVRLDGPRLERLAALIGRGEGYAQVCAAQGERFPGAEHLHDLAGPDLDLKIEVNRDSPWPFERWRAETAFADYRFEGDGVRFRGLLLRPGDLILPNVNLDGNFVYSALSDPKGFCPHSAVFVILEAGERRYPAVIETYEKGLRAVPLCVFLNARYISYAEVYRHRDLDGASVAHVSDVAHAALADARGYNFDTHDDDRAYVCCTQVVLQLHRALGLEVLADFGAIVDPGVRETMRRLDYHHLDVFFTPIDFIRSELFQFVGWVDNGQPARLVARELVEQRFRERFSRADLDPARLPLMARVNLFGIRQMRARTPLGRLVSKVMGFDHGSLPKGPDRILAVVEPLEAELGKAVRGILPAVEARLAELDEMDLTVLLADPALTARVTELLPLRWLRA